MWRLWLVVFLLSGWAARAEEPPAAEGAFRAARALVAQKRYAEACVLFEASHRIEPALGTLLNLADCYENLGKLASAYEAFREAALWAQKNGEVRREQVAAQRAEGLRLRLVSVFVDVEETNARVEVFTLPSHTLVLALSVRGPPAPIVLELGTYLLKVTAPDRSAFEQVLTLDNPGESKVVVRLEPDVPLVAALSANQEPAEHVVTDATAGRARLGPVVSVVGGIALTAVGIVGLAYGADVLTRVARQQPGGPDEGHPTVTRSQYSAAQVVTPVAIGSALVGVAAVVIGAVYWRHPQEPKVSLLPSPQGAQVVVEVLF